MDLQEKTRMEDTYKDINLIIDHISNLSVGQPLVWVYAWDVARDLWQDITDGGDPEYYVSKDLKEVWELFWTGADKNGFTLEYGTEDLYESIRDWMIDESIIEEFDREEEDLIESGQGKE